MFSFNMITVWCWSVSTKHSTHLAYYVKYMAVVIQWVWTDDSCCYKKKWKKRSGVCNTV